MALAIDAQKRTSADSEAIRESGFIPAVAYGPQMETVSIQVDKRTFDKLYEEVGDSTLFDLVIDGASPVTVIMQDMQYHATKDQVTHVDFLQVNMQQEMTVSIEIEFIGESLAIKQGGTLVAPSTTLEVTCLPKDLVPEIQVDLSVLDSFDKVIKVEDLKLPAGLVATLDPHAIVASISSPLTEEQIAAMDSSGPTSIEEIKVEEKGKKEVEADSKE